MTVNRTSPKDRSAWLTLADRYVADAQAELDASMAAPPAKSGPRRTCQSRRAGRNAIGEPAKTIAVMTDFYIKRAERRLAHQAALIGRLAAQDHDTSRADDQFWVMGQLLDAMRERRQLIAGEDAENLQSSAGCVAGTNWPDV